MCVEVLWLALANGRLNLASGHTQTERSAPQAIACPCFIRRDGAAALFAPAKVTGSRLRVCDHLLRPHVIIYFEDA